MANFTMEQNKYFIVPGFPLDARCTEEGKKLKKSLEESENYGNNFKFPVKGDNLEIKNKNRKMVMALLSSFPIVYKNTC